MSPTAVSATTQRPTLAAFASILRTDRLVEILQENYEIPDISSCELISHNTNDVYRVRSNQMIAYLKVYGHTVSSTTSHIDTELHIVSHLANAGLRIAPPVQLRSGNSRLIVIAPEGPRSLVMYAEAPGIPLSVRFSERSCARLGQYLASLHANIASMPTSGLSLRAIDHADALHALTDYSQTTFQANRIINRLSVLGRQLKELMLHTDRSLAAEGGKVFCHGDIHDLNVHVSNDETVTLFDFDKWHHGWKAYDLATFLRALVVRFRITAGNLSLSDFEESEGQRCWRAFLNGYESVTKLSEDEQRAIYALVPVRRIIELYWSLIGSKIHGTKMFSAPKLNIGLDFIEYWIKHYALMK